MADDDKKPIIKKVKKVDGGGAHGGAWKVAYADFVTAMMAFFMLLWLLNVAPPETLAGLADYFSPTSAAVIGKTGSDSINPPSEDAEGMNPSPLVIISDPGKPQTGPSEGKEKGGKGDSKLDELAERIKDQEDLAFEDLQEQLRLAIQQSPQLSEMSDQVIMEITDEGMKIQLVDKDRRAMFKSGTDDLYGYAKAMIAAVGESVATLPNRLTIEGHTDGGAFSGPNGMTNWELSADRANAARRVLDETGVTNDRIAEVIGKASTDPIFPDNPFKSENRRITVLVLREAPVVPPSAGN
ncbi:flagellar motor protein MotB [Pseudokordiimonas caeni]|uniref:flagellar motor protein MotB n=1 Tax=Pseudokordiimonas caeni TaxID=2997908 RepID=UPI002811C4F6|nr:flagellar motor protein MotB [Pseudokordiimonas caeni]